jgi:hypothetical protein
MLHGARLIAQGRRVALGKNEASIADDVGNLAAVEAMTGTPQAMASTSTRPNCSFQFDRLRDGKTSTSSDR